MNKRFDFQGRQIAERALYCTGEDAADLETC